MKRQEWHQVHTGTQALLVSFLQLPQSFVKVHVEAIKFKEKKTPKVLDGKMRNKQVFLLSPKWKQNSNCLHQRVMGKDLVSPVTRAERGI